MITKEEFECINEYADVLVKWSEGRTTIVNRKMWADLYPIAKKYLQFGGTLGCSYCCTQLCRSAHTLWKEYQEGQKDEKNAKKGKRKDS